MNVQNCKYIYIFMCHTWCRFEILYERKFYLQNSSTEAKNL